MKKVARKMCQNNTWKPLIGVAPHVGLQVMCLGVSDNHPDLEKVSKLFYGSQIQCKFAKLGSKINQIGCMFTCFLCHFLEILLLFLHKRNIIRCQEKIWMKKHNLKHIATWVKSQLEKMDFEILKFVIK